MPDDPILNPNYFAGDDVRSPGDTVMPFGKHKGAKLASIPTGYLDWLLGLDNLKDELSADIFAVLNTRQDWIQMDDDFPPNEFMDQD